MFNKLPSVDYLNEMFTYDPFRGLLYWKERPLNHFKTRGAHKAWNTKWSGKTAGNIRYDKRNGKTYLCVGFLGKLWFNHRVIFKMLHGIEPEQIDHKDGDGTNNKIDNLRASNQNDNGKNKHLLSSNTSSVCGVSYHKRMMKWRARITVDGVMIHLGTFENFEDAVKARKEADLKYKFHKGHGTVRPL